MKDRSPFRYSRDHAFAEHFDAGAYRLDVKKQSEYYMRSKGWAVGKHEATKNANQVGNHCGNTRGERFWLDVADALDSLVQEGEMHEG